MRATIKDIAAKTNLSVTTVSLVLNNKPCKIPDSTKKLVLDTAIAMDYRRNQLAVSLLKKRTRTIGIILSDIRNSFFSSLAKGVEDECRKRGWTVILCNTSDLHERDLECINMLGSKSVDGILYCMSVDSSLQKFEESRALLRAWGIPFVVIDRSFELEGLTIVKVDHVMGGFLATCHLLELGHRRIACVTGPDHLVDSRERLDGYSKALEKYGVKYDPDIIIAGNYDMQSGMAGVDRLMSKDFSAIFAFNDLMAYGAHKGLRRYDLAVPDDVSIVGYDDVFFAELFETPLTTIHQPVRRLGVTAVRTLISLVEHEPGVAPVTLLKPELVVRKSSAIFR